MKGATDFTFKGVAWSGGGRGIGRVDVSMDGGESWIAAELYKPIEQKYNHHWAWTQFYKTVALTDEVKEKLARGEKVDLEITSKVCCMDLFIFERARVHLICLTIWHPDSMLFI